jgi:hypothetical protein
MVGKKQMQKIILLCTMVTLNTFSLVAMIPSEYDMSNQYHSQSVLTQSIDTDQYYIDPLGASTSRSSSILDEELREPYTIYNLPAYYTAITETLLNQPIHITKRPTETHNHHVLALNNWLDCRITAIISGNNTYTTGITSFGFGPEYDYNADPQRAFCRFKYGIKCPAKYTNPLTRRLVFKAIDRLQRNWKYTYPNEYYTNPYKELPADNPHKHDITKWFFLSKRADILQEEPALIRFLVARFGMSNVVTCRATMTSDFRCIAAIHLWILKSALPVFMAIFDFEL